MLTGHSFMVCTRILVHRWGPTIRIFVCLTNGLPCKQRLLFHCVSWPAKSSLCRQPFKSIQKSGRINLQKRFFPVIDRFGTLHESWVADQSCRNFFYYCENSCDLTTDLMITFACKSRDEFRACTIEN